MRKLVMAFAGSATALAAIACDNPIEVKNKNNPDVERAYSTPGGVEQVIGSTYQLIHSADMGSASSINPGLMSMSFENASPLGNYNMGVRSGLPRVAIQNTPGNATAVENFRDFSGLQRTSRTAANTVVALDRIIANGGTTGSVAQNARAFAFAHFASGVALAHLAMAYDSAAIVTPEVVKSLPTPDFVPPLASYKEVGAAALLMLDSAIIIATNAGTAMPNLPDTWIKGNALSQANFIRVVRSFRARYRISFARTKAERDAINWDLVLADAQNGITADLNLALDPATGWDQGWFVQHYIFGGWHQLSPVIFGMADTSGAYASWMALAPNTRTPFLIQTPDLRFPQGTSRAAQQTYSNAANRGRPGSALAPPLYIMNRSSGDDIPGDPSGTSFYDHYRFAALYLAARVGAWPVFTKAENDMIQAEAHLMKNSIPSAVALINPWRTRAGLPALDPAMSATAPVPGGSACVPRAPIGPSNGVTNTPVCGNVFEAMKWEKRMEIAYTAWSPWFWDSRRWGDLAEGTPLHYAVPYQEMNARGTPFRTSVGGLNGEDAAPKGTYGY